MKYDPRLIYSFLAFSESSNIVEAAESLGLSQPALSAHLKSFEKMFEVPVFQMQGRKKMLTPFGQEIRGLLRDKLQGIDDLIDQATMKFTHLDRAVVRIAGRREIINRIIADIDFAGQIVGIYTTSEEGLEKLERFEADLLISHLKPDNLHMIAKPFFEDDFQLIIPKRVKTSAMLSKRGLVNLSAEPYFSYKLEWDFLMKLYERYEIVQLPKIFRVIQDWKTLIGLCEAGLGWTLAPTSFEVDESKCTIVPVSRAILPSTRFYLIYPKALSKVPWFTDLVSQLKELAQPLIASKKVGYAHPYRVFGEGESVYASHIVYKEPHNYQVLLKSLFVLSLV